MKVLQGNDLASLCLISVRSLGLSCFCSLPSFVLWGPFLIGYSSVNQYKAELGFFFFPPAKIKPHLQ